MFQNKSNQKILKTIGLVLLVLLAYNIVFDLYYTYKYGGIDLRDKIVGARLLFTDYSNYTSWWTPDYPVYYLNPADDLSTPLSMYTGTPFQSLVFLPLAQFNYNFIRYFWFVLQYAFLFSLFYLFFQIVKDSRVKSILLLGVFVLFFISTEQWHMHIERGQFYILFAFLHGLIYCILKNKGKFKEISSGIVLGILILFKPTFAVFGAPFFFKKKIKMLSSTTLTMVFFGLIFGFLGLFGKWSEYFTAMKGWQEANVYLSESKGNNAELVEAGIIPEVIEGSSNLRKTSSLYSENSSIQKIVHSFTGIKIDPLHLYGIAAILLSIILLSLIKQFPYFEVEEQILLGYLMWVVTMLCLAAPRFSYQYIHWIVPISIIAINVERYNFNIILSLLIGVILNLGIRFFMITLPYPLFIGELFLLAGIYMLLLNAKEHNQHKNNSIYYYSF